MRHEKGARVDVAVVVAGPGVRVRLAAVGPGSAEGLVLEVEGEDDLVLSSSSVGGRKDGV